MIGHAQALLSAVLPDRDPAADQAHLTRDFTVTIGVSPTRYTAPAGPPAG